MKKIYLYLGLVAVIVGGYLYVHTHIGRPDSPIQSLKQLLPEESVRFLRETLFVYKNQEFLKTQLADKDREIARIRKSLNETETTLKKQLAEKDLEVEAKKKQLAKRTKEIKQLNEQVENRDVKLELQERVLIKLSAELEAIGFYQNDGPIDLRIGAADYLFKKFETHSLAFGKVHKAIGSSYLDYSDGNLFLATGTGMFAYVDVTEFTGDSFAMTVLPSNIKDVVTYPEFYGSTIYGIKDLLIHDGQVYISFTNQVSPGCFSTSILVSKLDLEQLVFREFFTPSLCVAEDNAYGEFNAIQAGGRMASYKDDQLLFSVGVFKYRDHAQDESNVFGKIVAIDIESGKPRVVSMGHRNVQGLAYVQEDDVIVLTDHGPYGGDEINVHRSPDEEIKNFGWPVSSYGEHYKSPDMDALYQKAPLHKSHSDHGFVEPATYFETAIGISQIVSIPASQAGAREFLVGSMGIDSRKDNMSIHHLILDDNYTVLDSSFDPLGERVRDLIFVEELGRVFLFLETSPSIGVLELNREN